MITGERRSVDHVKALWALNEIKSDRTKKFYHDIRVPEILHSLGTGTDSVVDPGSSEFRVLIEMFEAAREKFLYMYFNGVKEFVMEQWPVERLCAVKAMSQMDPLGRGRFISVLAFALSPPPAGADDGDPRVAAARAPLSDAPIIPTEPVIAGLYNGLQVLIDGYRRSILFLRSAGQDDCIPILVPIAA